MNRSVFGAHAHRLRSCQRQQGHYSRNGLKGLNLLSLQRKLNSQNAKVAMFARWNVVAVVLVLAICGVSSAADIFGAVASDRVSELSQMVEENPRLFEQTRSRWPDTTYECSPIW
jgi:hypothetical protein